MPGTVPYKNMIEDGNKTRNKVMYSEEKKRPTRINTAQRAKKKVETKLKSEKIPCLKDSPEKRTEEKN